MSKISFSFLYRFLSAFVAICLLSADLASAAALIDFQGPEPIGTPVTVVVPPAEEQALFRTTVTLRQPRDLERVRAMGAVVLEADETSALLLVTAPQLADLARLRFAPTASDELGALTQAAGPSYEWLRAELRPTLERAAEVSVQWSVVSDQTTDDGRQTAARAAELAGLLATVSAGQRAAIATLAATDADNDGLTDTQEGWWCTNPAAANSDNLGPNDGAEVSALRAWLANETSGYPASGKPFLGWPKSIAGCQDDDRDSVPDVAEEMDLGLDPNRESTDFDKFDDGQELFGITDCCTDSGLLPRSVDAITNNMPAWVEPPGKHPMVASFPEPELSVVAGSWTVERVTVITTAEGTMTETSNSYATTVTEGQGSSVADTRTWENWQEVSHSVEKPLNPANPLEQPAGISNQFWGGVKIAGGVLAVTAGCGVGIAATVGYALLCGAGLTAGLASVKDGWDQFNDHSDEIQNQTQPAKKSGGLLMCVDRPQCRSNSVENKAQVALTQPFDTQGILDSLDGVQYAINQQGQLLSRGLQSISYELSRPRVTDTETTGQSWGGAQTTTHEQYEEHAVTNGQQFTTGQNWSTAWAVDSAHAADLRFTFRVDNTGTEYFRELTGLIINVYLGNDTTPLVSYTAWEKFPNGKLENFYPADPAKQFASNPVPLTLEQMKRIDLGEKLTIVVEDFSYGADEGFYNLAINGGVEVLIEDGAADNDETVDRYVIPTWGVESVQDVLTRAFPATEDAQGNLIALKTAEFNGTQPPVWNEYTLSDIAWWNVYQSCATDCANVGATPLQEQMAQAGSSILFRFNRDSDRDGYKDSVEWRYGTDRNNPASHPTPEMLAGYTLTRSGNQVTGLLKLLNNGTFDAYGIDAVIYAPDDSITITNNTVGGNGRVRSGDSVAVGALIQPPNRANMGASTAKVYAAGNYTGSADRVYTFTVQNAGVVGAGNTSMTWSDGTGMTPQVLQVGSAYHPPLLIPVANGLHVGLDSGTLAAGARFTVQTLIPRDTFKFTINREPYTPPVVVVSYSDPQGSHRFITPVALGSLEDDLNAHTGRMLPGVGLTISANGPFNPSGNNATDFILNSPDATAIQGAKLYLDFVSDGKLVKEIVQTFDQQPGPTVRSATWSAASFNADYHPDGDKILLAFWTDAQDNIIDSAARPFNTLQDDPTAVLEVEAEYLSWNFGTAKQGTLLQRPLLIGNTGRQALLLRAGAANGLALVGPQTVEAGGLGAYTLALDTTPLAVGPYSAQVTIRTSDPARPAVTVNVSGTIQAGTPDSGGGGLARPLDWLATITGAHNAGEWVTYSHTLGPEPQTLHPARVYSTDYTTFLGTGEYATDFAAGTAPGDMFGDGRDGVMPPNGNLDYENGTALGSVSGSAGSTIVSVTDHVQMSRVNPGDVVLIHQTQFVDAGNWELNRAVSDFTGSGTFELQKPLQHTYTAGAQIIRVPQYSTCNLTGTISPNRNWDGQVGGIVAVMCNGTLNVSGAVSASNSGFRGGREQIGNSHLGGEGGEGIDGRSGHGGGGDEPHTATAPGGGGRSMDHYNPPAGPGKGTGGAGGGYVFGSQRDEGGGGGGGGGHVYGGGGGGGGSDSNLSGGTGGLANGALGGGGGGGSGSGGQIAGNGGNSGQAGGSTGGISGGAGGAATQTGGGGWGYTSRDTGAGGGGGGGNFVPITPSAVVFGSGGGGGGGHESRNETGGAGGNGGGIIMLLARGISVSGTVESNGYTGDVRQYGGGGGGGAGGSILIRTRNGDIGAYRLTTAGGNSGAAGTGGDGGHGSIGRVRLEYCESLTGTPPSVAELVNINCHIAEQTETTPFTQGNLNIPESFTNGRTYAIQYGRRFVYTAAGEQTSTLRVPAGVFNSATLHALVSGVGSGSVGFKLDVGNDGSWDWETTQAVTNAIDLTSPTLATAFNAYWTSHGAPSSGTLDVPVRVYLSKPGQVLLTDLQMTGGGSSLRYVRLPAGSYGSVALDLTVAGSGSGALTLAADVGDDGTVDWSTSGSGPFPRALTTGNLSAAVNAYLAGKSGDVDVPVRLTYTPFNGVSITRAVTSAATLPDGAITNADVSLTQTNLTEGDTTTVNATVRGSAAIDGVTVGFFASLPNGLDWYLGSQYLPSVSPSGTATSLVWDTTGFTGATTVKVIIDPTNTLAETNEANNQGTKSATVKTRPNLRVTAIAPATSFPVSGETLTVNVTVQNNGQSPSAAAVCSLYLGNPDAGGTLIGSQACGPLGANTDVSLTYTWTPVAVGPARLFARADSGHALDEPDEFDNDRWLDLDVADPGPMPPFEPKQPTPGHGDPNIPVTQNLSWTGGDPNPGDTVNYKVYLDTFTPPTTQKITQSATTYDPPGDLIQCTTYYWQIVATDNTNRTTSGPVWRFSTYCPTNTNPTAPSNPNPANGTTGVSKTIGQVCWAASTDADGDPVTYDVAFGTSNPPAPVSSGQSGTCYATGPLAGHTTHYWKVTAKDNRGGSTAGPVWSFTTANTAPTAPSTPNPANGATGVSKTPQLCWAASSDGDGDAVTYDVYRGTTNPPTTVVSSNQAATCYTSDPLAGHTTYYWKVVAEDAFGGAGSSGVWSFTTANTAPTAPSSPNPADGATNVPVNTQVCWTASTDGDVDAVSYDVYFGTVNPPPLVSSAQNAACYDPPGDLTGNATYYWKVVAKDAFGGATPGPVWTFTTAGGGSTAPGVFYISPSGAATIGGYAATGADILRYARPSNSWDMIYDGSTIRTPKNVGAFAFQGSDLLLGFSAAQVVPGLGATAAAPQDLVRFTPTRTGYNNTAGSFAWFFDGSDVGLTTSGEIVDALWIDAAGRLYISTAGSGAVPENSANPTGGTLKFQDEDVLRFTPAAGSSGATTAGTWELYWDPTLMTGMSAEDINGYWEDPATGDRYATILGAFTIGNAAYGGRYTGNGKTILRFAPNAAAPGGWAPAEKVTWLAAGATFPSNLDGIELAR